MAPDLCESKQKGPEEGAGGETVAQFAIPLNIISFSVSRAHCQSSKASSVLLKESLLRTHFQMLSDKNGQVNLFVPPITEVMESSRSLWQ